MNFSKFQKKEVLALAILAILHIVGLVGLNSIWKDYFVGLTALNLLITAVLVFPFNKSTRLAQLSFFLLAFSFGMLVEIVGVKTGFPFGNYHYSSILSFSFLSVPLIIGVNWFLLSYGIISALNWQLSKLPYLLKVFFAALLMTLMDVLIEPFAIHHQLWIWENNAVPVQNYLSWFFISFLLFAIGFKVLKNETNVVAALACLVMLIFFVLNNLLLTML